MASDSGSELPDTATDAARSETQTLQGLFAHMSTQGVQEAKLDSLRILLISCNVCTMGALRAFHESLGACIDTLFDVTTVLGKLQAQGLLASLRVRTRNEIKRSVPTPLPFKHCLSFALALFVPHRIMQVSPYRVRASSHCRAPRAKENERTVVLAVSGLVLVSCAWPT